MKSIDITNALLGGVFCKVHRDKMILGGPFSLVNSELSTCTVRWQQISVADVSPKVATVDFVRFGETVA